MRRADNRRETNSRRLKIGFWSVVFFIALTIITLLILSFAGIIIYLGARYTDCSYNPAMPVWLIFSGSLIIFLVVCILTSIVLFNIFYSKFEERSHKRHFVIGLILFNSLILAIMYVSYLLGSWMFSPDIEVNYSDPKSAHFCQKPVFVGAKYTVEAERAIFDFIIFALVPISAVALAVYLLFNVVMKRVR